MQLFCLLVALCIVCYAVCANESFLIAGGGRTYAKQKRLCRKKTTQPLIIMLVVFMSMRQRIRIRKKACIRLPELPLQQRL